MHDIVITTLDPADWQAYRNIRLESLREEPQAFLSRHKQSRTEPTEKWQERLSGKTRIAPKSFLYILGKNFAERELPKN